MPNVQRSPPATPSQETDNTGTDKTADESRKLTGSGCSKLSLNPSSKDCTPTRNVNISRGNKRPALNSPPENKMLTSDDVREIVQDVVKTELAAMLQKWKSTIVSVINEELEPMRSEVRELSVSLDFHTKQFEEFQSEHVALKNTVKELKDENIQLNRSNLELNQRLNNLEQQARSNNLEKQCCPENKQYLRVVGQ